MFDRDLCKNLLITGFFLAIPIGCGNRQGKAVASSPAMAPAPAPAVAVAEPMVRTFQSAPPAIQFDYPADWVSDKTQTAVFSVAAPKCSAASYSSLSLDIPKLPWHLPGMITLNMVANGYIEDLKKHQIHDAIVKEQCPLTICGATGQRITCAGHANGNPSIDMAVVLIHADQVYILSADSDQAGYDTARKTLDAAVASLKWTK